MNKESVSLRLDPEMLKWLERNNRKWSQQLRRDLRSLQLLESFVTQGMSDHPLGKMMLMADNEFKE